MARGGRRHSQGHTKKGEKRNMSIERRSTEDRQTMTARENPVFSFSTYQPIYLFTNPSIHPSIFQPIHPAIQIQHESIYNSSLPPIHRHQYSTDYNITNYLIQSSFFPFFSRLTPPSKKIVNGNQANEVP